MTRSRRSFLIPSLVLLAILTFALCSCRSSMDVAEGPPAPPPPPPPPAIEVSHNAAIPPDRFIVYVSEKDENVDWTLTDPSDSLDIQIDAGSIGDPFDPVICEDKNGQSGNGNKKNKCSVKVKKSKNHCEPALGYKYGIVVTHNDGTQSVNDPVIIWR